MDASKKLSAFKKGEDSKVKGYLSKADPKAYGKYAEGGKVRGNTTVNIVVGKDQQPQMPPPPPPAPPPPPPPPMAGPPPGGAPAGGLGGIGAGAPQPGGAGPLGLPGLGGGLGMKSGGHPATALAMDAGAMSGPGRIEKAMSEAKKENKTVGFKKKNA